MTGWVLFSIAFPTFAFWLTFAILMEIRWALQDVLTYISLIARENEYLWDISSNFFIYFNFLRCIAGKIFSNSVEFLITIFLVMQTFFILCGFISQLLALILVNEVLFRQSFPVRTSYKVLPMLSSTNPRVLDVTFSS